MSKSEDVLDRYREHMSGVTMSECRTPTLLDDMAAEIERLREGLRALCHEAWGYADLEGGDIQDKLESLGILVQVPASDDIREEYDCDTMYTVAWSEAALEESRDD